jgi:hypothetical protein
MVDGSLSPPVAEEVLSGRIDGIGADNEDVVPARDVSGDGLQRAPGEVDMIAIDQNTDRDRRLIRRLSLPAEASSWRSRPPAAG